MHKDNISTLRRFLVESEFRFVAAGEYALDDIYRLVKAKFPELCDDTVLCS